VGAVHIPLHELGARLHELPPPRKAIRLLCDSLDAYYALGWLHARGRQARLASAVEIKCLDSDSDAPPTRYRLWEPNEWLQEVIEALAPAYSMRRGEPTALDLGCGSGRDAVYLADLGYQVVAVDRLPEALERGRDLQRRYAPDSPPIQWVCADLEKSDWQPHRAFELITLFYFYSSTLIPRVCDWLKPGGTLLIEAFTPEHRMHFGKPASSLRVVQLGELQRHLPPTIRIVDHSEGWRSNGRHTARLWAVRK
jgi:SAM-dependent methyltransferase